LTDQASDLRASASQWDGVQLLGAFQAAARWLTQHTESVNALNVFPVPDGDTGTNMSLTLNGAVQDVEADPSCAVVADRVKYWATMRGRGNSGIILSQVLRGIAVALAGHTTMDGAALAAALTQAGATAYQAVMRPVEGTMLTVIRETGEAAVAAAAAPNATLLSVLQAASAGAFASVKRTPDLLPMLRDAGVVDSGGQGLALIFEGMLRYALGESLELDTAIEATPAATFEDIHGPDDFGYCTNFVLQGSQLPFAEIRETLAEMGQSAVIVGDSDLIKVHIHLLRPGDALNYAVGFGVLANIEITNMDLQREALHEQAQAAAPVSEPQTPMASVGVVAVAPSDGFAKLFRSLNVDAVIGGGQTMNPSTEDLLQAIESLPQSEVIVLPNNSNIVMAARQAASLSTKQVAVIPTKTVPQGIAARLSFNYQASLDANVPVMQDAVSSIVTAEITTAVRDALVDGVQVLAGQTIVLLDGALVIASDSREQAFEQALERMELDDREILTIYIGQDASSDEAEKLAEYVQEQYPDIEVELQQGDQPVYDYIVSAE
jgi:DAK2 domain fusion protein YloV